jgi:hypothetical protein
VATHEEKKDCSWDTSSADFEGLDA